MLVLERIFLVPSPGDSLPYCIVPCDPPDFLLAYVRWSFPRVIRSPFYQLLAGFLLGVVFDTEDGGGTFLRNIGGSIPNYTTLHPGRWYSGVRILVRQF
jgi:hypothetical protein